MTQDTGSTTPRPEAVPTESTPAAASDPRPASALPAEAPVRMHAAVIDGVGGPERLHLAEIDTPVRVNAEVLVKVTAAGINPIDAKTRAGRGVSRAIAGFPVVLGNDFCGVVVESPYEGHPLKPGDEVYGMSAVPRGGGSYAEYLAVPSTQVARKPRRLTQVEAAGVPLAALTAWGLVVDVAKAHEGQRILIHAGSGGVGHFAVQLAAYFGAQVVATASGGNANWLRGLGAQEVIDYTSTRFDEVLSDLDVVIDLIGNVHDDTGTRSLRVLRQGGLIVNVPTGSWPTFIEDATAAGLRATSFRVAPEASTLGIISRLIDSGDLHVHIAEIFPLKDADAAHALLERGHTRGKIVLQIT